MMAFFTTACGPTSTPCSITESSTVAHWRTRTPGESIERLTTLPEMMAPSHTIESTARPSPASVLTNLAGGSGSLHVRMGHRRL